MKINGNFKEWAVSQTLLAKILGISVPRVNQLIEEEVVIRDPQDKGGSVLLIESIINYYLSKKTTGASVNFWKERALHEKANREMAELKLAERRGELYEAQAVDLAFTEMTTVLKNQLLGLPMKLAAELEGKSRQEINTRLNEEIESSLMELSKTYETEKFSQDES